MAAQLAAFRPNTRQRIQRIGSLPIANATTQQVTFPQVGLLARIYLFVNATVTDTASESAVLSTFGPWNILKRIQGLTNLGTATVFDLSGYGAYLVSKVTDTTVELGAAGSDVTAPDPMYNIPTNLGTTATPVSFVLMIPVSVNDGDQFQIGLLNLQAPEIRFTLSLTFSSTPGAPATGLADAFVTSNTLTLGGQVFVYYEYYEVPDPAQVMLPPRVMFRQVEDRIPILGTGDTTYLFPRQGIILQAIHNVIINGAVNKSPSAVLARRLVFNKTDTPYQFDYIVDRILNRYRYGFPGTNKDLPAGAHIWDMYDAQQEPSRGDLRDAIDSEALNTLESVITIAPGVTLGANNNFIDTVRRFTQQY
jgi:hypothetical protein